MIKQRRWIQHWCSPTFLFQLAFLDFLRTLATGMVCSFSLCYIPWCSWGLSWPLSPDTQFFCSNSLFIPSFLNKTLTESIHHRAWWEKWQRAHSCEPGGCWAPAEGRAEPQCSFFFPCNPYLCEYEHSIPALRSLLFLCKTRKAGLQKIGLKVVLDVWEGETGLLTKQLLLGWCLMTSHHWNFCFKNKILS